MTRSVLRGLRAVALTGTLVLAAGAAFAADPIKLGVLEDQSGDFAAATIGKVHAIQLATEEIKLRLEIAVGHFIRERSRFK